MSNLQVLFSTPWLLLLIIPALLFTILPYFRVKKRYRRTRNRVCSMAIHALVMVFAIMLLAGLTFAYTVPNTDNSLILLVDVSYSNEDTQQAKDDYIKSVANACDGNYQFGIVKFAYDQVYAGTLSLDADAVYNEYINSADPDTSATDLASALKYAASLFENPESSKIVIVSDGIETDGDAANAIKTVAAQGIKVDTAYFGNSVENEIQIIDATLPDYNVTTGVEETLSVTLEGDINYDGNVKITMYDDTSDEDTITTVVYNDTLAEGVQTVEFAYTFNLPGLHTLRFEITNNKDTLLYNNTYYAYLYIEHFDDILVLESIAGESESVVETLVGEDEDGYNVTVYNVNTDREYIPSTITELSKYDQVILVNISYDDLNTNVPGFEDILYEYVYKLGGGLLTVGGENDVNDTGDTVSHAYYNRDLLESKYLRSMLPVTAVDGYVPPVSFLLLCDVSGSMTNSKMEQAIAGALACLDSLSSRDYVGIIEFGSTAHVTLSMTSVANREVIETAMRNMGTDTSVGYSTCFEQAMYLAGLELSRTDTAFKHIILITDGMPNDDGAYQQYIESNYKSYGITMSVVGIQLNATAYARMLSDVELCNCSGQVLNASEESEISFFILQSFQTNVTDKINATIESFVPEIADYSAAAVAGLSQSDMPALTGYYGTVLKSGATLVLSGPWDVPIYAQWSYGEGTVGSFLCSFNTDADSWSSTFASNIYGQQFLNNAVASVMPKSAIDQSDISVSFIEDNYTNQLNVYTELEEGGSVEVTITPLTLDAELEYANNPIEITMAANYTRFTFVITTPGLYRIDIQRLDAYGDVSETLTVYKSFSYSEEYNLFPDTDGEQFLTSLAESGDGIVVTDISEIFDTFNKYISKVFDPRIILLILIIVLLLLDIAVRKFKFKWPHEIIRARREKKLQEQQKAEVTT